METNYLNNIKAMHGTNHNSHSSETWLIINRLMYSIEFTARFGKDSNRIVWSVLLFTKLYRSASVFKNKKIKLDFYYGRFSNELTLMSFEMGYIATVVSKLLRP